MEVETVEGTKKVLGSNTHLFDYGCINEEMTFTGIGADGGLWDHCRSNNCGGAMRRS